MIPSTTVTVGICQQNSQSKAMDSLFVNIDVSIIFDFAMNCTHTPRSKLTQRELLFSFLINNVNCA